MSQEKPEYFGKYIWQLTFWSSIAQREVADLTFTSPRAALDSLKYLGDEEALISLTRTLNPNYAKPPAPDSEQAQERKFREIPEPLSR